MQVPVHTMTGETVGSLELPAAIFEAPINVSLMHQALVRQLANARQGTAKTKTRGEVAGSTRKMWRQKGTGRARQGSRKAPHWRKGGTVFGPSPRSYRQAMPKKMRRAALRGALSVKASQQQIVVVDSLELAAPKTAAMADFLAALGVSSALVLLPGRNENVELSIKNLPRVRHLRATYLNMRDLLAYDTLIMPREAVAVIEGFLG